MGATALLPLPLNAKVKSYNITSVPLTKGVWYLVFSISVYLLDQIREKSGMNE